VKRSLLTPVALATTAFLSLLSVSPALATTVTEAANLTQVFNCTTMEETGQIVALWETPTVVVLENCIGAYLGDAAATGNASTEDGLVDASGGLLVNDASEALTFTGEAEVALLVAAGGSTFASVLALDVYDMNDPSGVRLIDDSKALPLDAETFTIGTEAQHLAEDEIPIDGNEDCGILAAEHLYTLQRIHVSVAGEYTFRVVGTDPISSDMLLGSYTPIDDTMIALYKGDFDPANPDSAVAGCNDDFNDLTIDGFDWDVPNYQVMQDRVFAATEDGKALEGHFPVFTSNLTAGDYTMLVTTYWGLTSEAWNAGEDEFGTWDPAEAHIDYEVWGPEDGAELVDEFALASTGVDPSFGLWTGLALAGTGVAITVARRRTQRA
jgi:hypothetical protein